MSSKYLVGLSILFFLATKYLPSWIALTIICFGILYCLSVAWKCFKRIRQGENFDPSDYSEEDAKLSIHEVKSSMWLHLIFSGIFIVLIFLPIIKGASSNLDNDIATMNKDCPANFGDYSVQSFSHDKDYIIVNISISPEYYSLFKDVMTSQNGGNPSGDMNVKFSMCRNNNPIASLAKTHHMGLKINYFFKAPGDGFSVNIPYDEIIRLEKMPVSEINKLMLDNFVTTSNYNLPDTIDMGYILKRIMLRDGVIVYDFSVDDSLFDFQEYKTHSDELKQQIISDVIAAKSPNSIAYPMTKSIVDNHVGITYQWNATSSRDSILVTVEPEEISQYFNQ